MMHKPFDDNANLAAREALVSLFLPLALTLEADHFRVFLAVCMEDGISLQKLGRLTRLGQSEVIRATSMLESWQAGPDTCGLLHNEMALAKGYRRLSFLTASGKGLRAALQDAFDTDDYAEAAAAFHHFMQQELSAGFSEAAAEMVQA
ncbi:MAG TPA: hypothetical protein VN063_07525 [Methylophilaceae bacterium]|nr:hypothetical protein [Methylophilaceae bacterium]